ncbi:MAG: hypothetical protein FJ206_04590 [Gemmatimonadetes bacterium]|nr:hypothetical protein [Gemmatimonadota bacterium]
MLALLTLALVAQDTAVAVPRDSYADAATQHLVRQARAARERNEKLVTSYRAVATQRLGVGLKAASRDRMLYRQEVAAKIEWHRDRQSRIEVIGAREGIPIAIKGDRVPEELEDQLRWLVVNPAEDYLRLAGLNSDDGFIYPLRDGGERDYRFAIGDTTTIGLPSGKRVRIVQLEVTPRRADWRLISGSLWFDADSYGLVRAVFRPARPYEFRRDADDDDREDVPAWVNPTGEVKFVTLEYGLYEDRWWMLRYFALDAVGNLGAWLGVPIRWERVYADYEVEGGTPRPEGTTFRSAGTTRRGERLRSGEPIDSALRAQRRDSTARAVRECIREARATASGRGEERRRAVRVRIRTCTRGPVADSALAVVIPEDSAALITSPALGQPILAMGDLISEREIRGLADAIGALPSSPWDASVRLPSGVGSLLEKARFNRVEGLSLAVRGSADFGKLALDGGARIGFADRWPNMEGGLSGPLGSGRWRIGGYRHLAAANPDVKPFGVVNSAFGFFSQRDDGQYFRATGVDAVITSGGGGLVLRGYLEAQRPAQRETDFSLPHLFNGDRVFRPNLRADTADQIGLAVTVKGTTVLSRAVTLGGEVSLEGGRGDFDFEKGGVIGRLVVVPDGPVSFAATARAGTSRGTVPIQQRFFLGGPATLRGYDGGVVSGHAFWAGRLEVANSRPAVRLSGFADAGWAGERTAFSTGRPLLSAGVGASFLDGLIRMDLARALRAPMGWRFDLYFDGIL